MCEHTVSQAPSAPALAQSRRTVDESVAVALRRPWYEVLPLADTADQVEQHVPRTVPITVTASPRSGLEATVALTEDLAARGFEAVPHLSARLVRDEGHLAETLCRFDDAGVHDVFVIGGDGDRRAGDFGEALDLLTAFDRVRRHGCGRAITQVGVAGYPEGHPVVDQRRLAEALAAKQSLATYVVTQMCFEPEAVSAWVAQLPAQGVSLPVRVGIAGAVDRRTLLRVATRIGVGPSARFLRKHRYGLARLLLHGGYGADRMVRGMAADLAAPTSPVAGVHVYTLGAIAATERWRRSMLDRLDSHRSRT